MEPKFPDNYIIKHLVQTMMAIVVLVVIICVLFAYMFVKGDVRWDMFLPLREEVIIESDIPQEEIKAYWEAPVMPSASDEKSDLIAYGKDLIAHTAKYLGPKGSVAAVSNGLNCQNCHLDAGTKTFGNNYSAVAATYPKLRARSGSVEDIEKRVNDCFERSLNGRALVSGSREMEAIKAYITYIGKDVPKGERPKGVGLKDVPFLDRSCDPEKGEDIYIQKCASCHMANGEGMIAQDGIEYVYPPLWGDHSYNTGAGLYRITTFARYVKYNMPLGASHEFPQLSDEEAWDVAAYVNSMPRPVKNLDGDWPDISKKPIDHPFGPYADGFDEKQHKYGPYPPIIAAREALQNQ